jgi:hypothetical protein
MTDTVVQSGADVDAAPSTPFRWRLATRPDVRFGHAAGGVAGLLVFAAVFAFVVEVTDDDPTLPGVGFNVLLIAAAVAVGFWVRGPVRSAAVTALVFAVPALWLFVVIGDGDNVGRDDVRIIFLLTIVSYVVFYALTWTRGRAVFLGGALAVAATWIISEFADQDSPLGVGAAERVQRSGVDSPFSLFQDNTVRDVAIATIVVAVVLLATGTVLDRRRRYGAATPFILVGSIYGVVGAFILGTDVEDVYAAGIFIAIAGLVIGLVGSLGRRRGTSWFGAVVLLLGALTVVAQGTEDSVSGDGGAAVFGAFALVAAAVLIVLGVLVARGLDEPIDGGEPIIFRERQPQPEPVAVGATTETPVAPAPAAPPVDEATPPAEQWAEPTRDEAPTRTDEVPTQPEPMSEPPADETPTLTEEPEPPGADEPTPGDETPSSDDDKRET